MRARRFPPRRVVPAVVIAAFVLYPAIRPYDDYAQGVLALAFLLAVQAVSWNIISGYAGYVSLGHVTFLGVGSYTAGILAARTGVNPLVFAPLAGVVAVVVAVAVGAVVLRVRGFAFTIITIALLFAAQVIALNWASLTGGADGITLPIPGWSRDIANLPFYYLFLVLALAALGLAAWIRRTRFGAGLVAIREDEGKAATIGVDATRYKITAFAASSFLIGVAGAGYAYFLTFLNPVGAFSLIGGVTIVLSALLGGRGTLWGPAVGALVVGVAGEASTAFAGGSGGRVLVYGGALTLVVLFLPDGALPAVRRGWRRMTGRGVEAAVPYESEPAPLEIAVPERSHEPGRPLLEVRGLTKRFGGLVAVDGADLTVDAGGITGLIGPNGSGKTTLFNLVTGTLRADSGRIAFDGRDITRAGPWRRGHLGIGRTFQVTRLFPAMTVLENLTAPMPDARWRTMLAGAVHGPQADRARDLLAHLGLRDMAGVRAGALSYGQQKLVEFAQVLMADPALVLLDEPTGGVNPRLARRMIALVREMNARGVTFLVVEHDIPMVLELCDRVVVFARGRAIADGPPETIRTDPAVLEAYLGGADGASGESDAPSAPPAPPFASPTPSARPAAGGPGEQATGGPGGPASGEALR